VAHSPLFQATQTSVVGDGVVRMLPGRASCCQALQERNRPYQMGGVELAGCRYEFRQEKMYAEGRAATFHSVQATSRH
jgi:hypothetical protein